MKRSQASRQSRITYPNQEDLEGKIFDSVAIAFEKLHRENHFGLPVEGAFDTISHLLWMAFGDLKPNLASTVLDVGSAAGYRTRRSFQSFNLILLDCSKTALKQAMEDEGEESHVKYLLGDYFNIPLSDDSVDYVVANGVNEHYSGPKRQELFEEMFRVVKPGGRLAVIVPNKINPFHTLWKSCSEIKGIWKYGPQHDFTPYELYRRMSDLEFKSLQSFGVGAFTSWTRLFPRGEQRKLIKNPTPSPKLNKLLFSLDSKSNSYANKLFGREIMVVGYK